jgi:peptide/nickel transport system ATP-binding protein
MAALAEPLTQAAPPAGPAFRIRGLTVNYRVEQGDFAAVRDVDLDIPAGRISAIIGESGSGKSTLALSLLNGVPHPGRVVEGRIDHPQVGNVLALDREGLRRFRGEQLGVVFQASQSSLNPLKRVGAQLLDLARSHRADIHTVLKEAQVLCRRLALDPDRVLVAYQHQLSGGMRQRVGLIFALALKPSVLLLDEPTTALDVLSQTAVLEIVRELHRERHLTTVLITHDLGVVAELADETAVMYAGQVVEQGPTTTLMRRPQHPYTRALVRAMPRLTGDTRDAQPLSGQPPDLARIPTVGCVFRERCAYRMAICDTVRPVLAPVADGHLSACHLNTEGDSRD